ncbi:hypothetical protein BDZ97DRAFT_1918572 [Flammula alnicola]|nr:hypothetical protein BDZ97DRAFT_1918572 [Flammula alnicola]
MENAEIYGRPQREQHPMPNVSVQRSAVVDLAFKDEQDNPSLYKNGDHQDAQEARDALTMQQPPPAYIFDHSAHTFDTLRPVLPALDGSDCDMGGAWIRTLEDMRRDDHEVEP